MPRIVLLLIAAITIIAGIGIFAMPQFFYAQTPGVAQMGPFNLHFIRDVGLAFLASGVLVGWGAWTSQRALALAGGLWLALHAVFHVQIWVQRGFPWDYIFAFDVFAVIIPAIVIVWAARQLEKPF